MAPRVRLLEIGNRQPNIMMEGVQILVPKEFLDMPEIRTATD